MSEMGLGRVKTKSDLVVMPSGNNLLRFFALSVTVDIAPGRENVRYTPSCRHEFRSFSRGVALLCWAAGLESAATSDGTA